MINDPNALYLFLDTETTGLNRNRDQIWSLSWTLDTPGGNTLSKVDSFIHHMAQPSQWVKDNTAYEAVKETLPMIGWKHIWEAYKLLKSQIPKDRKVYLVGANPWFDDQMLVKCDPRFSKLYDYHKIDVENMTMALFDLVNPPRLDEVLTILSIPHPERHGSRVDCDLARDAFYKLRYWAKQPIEARMDLLASTTNAIAPSPTQ